MSKLLLSFMPAATHNLPAMAEHGMAKSQPVTANADTGKANCRSVTARTEAVPASSHTGRAKSQPLTAKDKRGLANPQAVRAMGQHLPLKSTLLRSFYI